MTRSSVRPALLLSLQRSGDYAAERHVSAAELSKLVTGLGYDVKEILEVKASESTSLFSETTREKIAERVSAHSPEPSDRRADEEEPLTLLIDGILSPGEQRELERVFELPVLDRVLVVLSIFERRARTELSRLEVELARLKYDLPRVRDITHLGDREGGGGRGGRGHTNVELRKQQIRERMAEVRRQIAALRERRRDQSERRSGVPLVALVGYTNAGKSSLLEALTASSVHVEDALFATLDTTVRALRREGPSRRILVSDTVGFLRRLPHELVASFESTLAEARTADLLLLVADASDPEWTSQVDVTRRTLSSVQLADIPSILVLNKADRLDEATKGELAKQYPDAVFTSARDPAGVSGLKARIEAFVDGPELEVTLRVPFTEPRLLAEVRAGATILRERYTAEGGELVIRARQNLVYGWVRELGP